MLRRIAATNRIGLTRPSLMRGMNGVVGTRSFHVGGPLRKEEEPVGPSLAEKYQLTDPTRYVPLTIAGFSVGTLTGLYHIDGETQLLALWVLFCGVVYSRGGPIISEMFEDIASQIEMEQKKAEEAEIAAVKATLDSHKATANLYEDVEQIFSGYISLVGDVSASAEGRLKRAVREEFVRRLTVMANAERKVSEQIQASMVESATEFVTEAYKKDKNLQKKALDAAIAALSSPEGAKKDTSVGDLYNSFFKKVASAMESGDADKYKLSAEDIQSIKEEVEPIARREGVDANSLQIA